MSELISSFPVPSKCSADYRSIAFDSCHFYLTSPHSLSILKFDRCFKSVSRIKTRRAYCCICYDSRQCCFWASSSCDTVLYKLDCDMCEIDKLSFHSDFCCGKITGLSYDCESDSLLVAFACRVLRVFKSGCAAQLLPDRNAWYCGVLALPPYFIAVYMCGCKQRICVYSLSGKPICSLPCQDDFNIISMTFDPCNCELLFLAEKPCNYYYILRCKMPMLPESLCPCNFDIHCCPSHNPCDSTCDIIESVALVEAALSHILNAEGEKLQRIIASTDNAETLLAVNRSVNQTVVNISHMEQILYDKLAAIRDIQDCHEPKDPCRIC